MSLPYQLSVGAGLVPARVLLKLTGRDKPCPYTYSVLW
jgi:hypothetical protein